MAEERIQRRLAAILAADVVGYSRLIERNEAGTLAALRERRKKILDPTVAHHHGRVVKVMGDGVLVEFGSAVNAVACAIELQKQFAAANAGSADDRQIVLRVGVNLGDVVVEGGDLYGDGVIIAVRLQTMAEPAGTCISGSVHEQVSGKLEAAFDDLGLCEVKNNSKPVRVFRLRSGGHDVPAHQTLALPDKPSIAALPFDNLSGDPEQDYFADGIVQDIITALSRMKWLFVIARNSSFTYKGRTVDIRQVGRELGVRYVLEGSVRKALNRVRITVQLIDATTGAHVWAERYDRPLEDVFAVQDEITDTIVATMEPEISASERNRARRKPPEHLGAWELYQRGMWHLLRRNKEELPMAQAYFRKAIALDPNFASSHAALAVSCFFQLTYGFAIEPSVTLGELLDEAFQAVAIDRSDSLGHSALGVGFMERGQLTDAIAEHQVAVSLNPNSSFARYAFGYTLEDAGRYDEAIEQFDAALRFNPKDPAGWSYLTLKSSSLYQLGRYDEALEVARVATRFPVVDLVWAYIHMTAALGQLNREDDARAAVVELCGRRPGLTIAKFRSWPHNMNQLRQKSIEHTVEGLRKAGLPE